MEITNTSRFTVIKNAVEFLQGENNSEDVKKALEKDICSADKFNYAYLWDPEFKAFFNWNFKRVEELWSLYKNIELLLKNIYWEKIFANLEKTVEELFGKIFLNQDWNTLAIVNMYPIEMAICWEVLKNVWFKNVVYNFNRQPYMNSWTKTLEALLFLVSYDNSKYFQNLSKTLRDKISSLKNVDFSKFYILFDENNSFCNYVFLTINDYLKTQIWMPEPKNVYRLDKYPTTDFLLKKSIKNVIVLDSDKDVWEGMEFYQKYIKEANAGINFKHEKYTLKDIADIGYYEDYLVKQDGEYMRYKANIIDKTALDIGSENTKKKWDKKKKVQEQNFVRDTRLVPYLVVFPVLVIAFIVSDTKWWTYYSSAWTGSTHHSSYRRSSSSWFWWSSWKPSSFINSTSNSSSIKSFWWGWFSKWGG